MPTLSTKVNANLYRDFGMVAEAHSQTKSSYLRELVKYHLDGGKVDEVKPNQSCLVPSSVALGGHSANCRSADRLPDLDHPQGSGSGKPSPCRPQQSVCLLPAHHLPQTTLTITKPVEYSGLPKGVSVDARSWSLVASPKDRSTLFHSAELDRPASSPKSSSNTGWWIVLGLLLLRLWSRSTDGSTPLPEQRPIMP